MCNLFCNCNDCKYFSNNLAAISDNGNENLKQEKMEIGIGKENIFHILSEHK